MKKLILGIVLMSICFVSYNMSPMEDNVLIEGFSLSSIEALAACETSSDPSENGGYCVRNYNSSDDSCVTQSSYDAVRCSGNI